MIADVFKYCSPTRSQINTGRYPYHNGFWHNNCPAAQLEGVPLKFITIAEELASAGYQTQSEPKQPPTTLTFRDVSDRLLVLSAPSASGTANFY